MKIASKQPLRTYYLIFVAMNIVNACIMLHKIYSHEHLIKGYCVFINVGIINIYSRRFISIEDADSLYVPTPQRILAKHIKPITVPK